MPGIEQDAEACCQNLAGIEAEPRDGYADHGRPGMIALSDDSYFPGNGNPRPLQSFSDIRDKLVIGNDQAVRARFSLHIHQQLDGDPGCTGCGMMHRDHPVRSCA